MSIRSSKLLVVYRLKLVLAAGAFFLGGVLVSTISLWLQSRGTPALVVDLLDGLADVLLVAGAIGLAVDFLTGQDRDAANLEATRATLRELTPDFTDAVVRSFAASPADLQRVATTDVLDQLATNAIGLRLGDAQFASEIYTDVRDQAIRAPERWHDVEVSVRLSGHAAHGADAVPRFTVLIEWEYTTVPSHAVRRFACVSDREEFDELVTEVPSTSTWFMTPRPDLHASSRDAFELLYFSVDGEERKIRRSERRTGQTYSASIGDDIVRAGKPVRIKHLYRTTVTQAGHYLFIELPQPTRDLSLKFDYTDAAVSRLTVMDLVTSAKRPEIVQMPAQVDARVLSVDLRGWLLPRAGFTFVWTLASEDQPSVAADEPSSARLAA